MASKDPDPPPSVASDPTGALAPASRPAPAGPTVFEPGRVVAGRYRVVRFIARGGMGEVYEVEDRELGERVALKTIRPEIAGDERILERFKREILLARRVTDPHICRIFDLGVDQSASGGVTFLTMELLAGETLADRLRRTGRLTTDEARPIAEQMAAALAAAHRAGVVHRDFKASNVVLVGPRDAAPRVVVTDFGLARPHAPDDAAPHVHSTHTGVVVGTPAYMAPEQVAGGPITPAADVYALGVVLYEMVTGVTPFAGDTPLSVAARRLTEPPAPPRHRVPDLDPRWNTAILRCLERDPARRFSAVADVLAALHGSAAGGGRRWSMAVAAVVTVAAVGAVALLGRHDRVLPEPTPTPPAAARAGPPRRAVAVLGFKNLSGRADAGWLSTALAEMLTTELAAGERLRTIPGEEVARMRADLVLAEADSYSADTLARIRSRVRADAVVLGSYLALGEGASAQIRLDLRLQDAAAGETITSVAEQGSIAELFDLVARCGARLRRDLGAGESGAQEARAARAALPGSTAALRLYAEGLARLRLFDAVAARERLEQAVAADPKAPRVHAALSQAWSVLGYDARAAAEAQTALALSAHAGREERLVVEARAHRATGAHAKAADVYRALAAFFPDDLDYALDLAAAETAAGRPARALDVVDGLRRGPGARDEARIGVVEAEAAEALADFKRERDAAARAARAAEANGARLLAARARRLEAWAVWRLGDPERARTLTEEARAILDRAGDRAGAARCLTMLGLLRYTAGAHVEARRLYDDALALSRSIGDRKGEAMATNQIAILLKYRGDFAGARRFYSQAIAIDRETGDRDGLAKTLNNLSMLLYNEGALAESQKLAEESEQIRRQTGDRTNLYHAVYRVGDVLWAQGDLAGARRRYQDGVAICRELGEKRQVAYGLSYVGEVLVLEGDLSGAREAQEEALALRTELGEKSLAVENRIDLAAIVLEEGRPAEAEAAARRAAEESQQAEEEGREAWARGVLARALLAEGRVADARVAAGRARALAEKSGDRLQRWDTATVEARVAAAEGRAAEARRRLEAVVGETTRLGFVPPQLEARLALGEIDAGRDGGARARLEALEREARDKGFGLFARRARALLQR